MYNHSITAGKYAACVFVAALVLAMSACGSRGSTFTIKGKFRDMQAGELHIYNLLGVNTCFDTLTVADGSFKYTGEVEGTMPFMLVFPNGIQQVVFAGPGQDIKYEATANDLKNYVASGNDENKLMNKFRQETYTQTPSEVMATAHRYISENAESQAAIYLLDTYFINNPDADHGDTRELLDLLKSSQPNSNQVLAIEHRFNAASLLQVGNTMQDVTLTARNNKEKKLWHTQNDYNLIVFWAMWHPEGYDFAWKLRQLGDEYKHTGKLRVAAVSLDIERHRWDNVSRDDSLTAIEHYCDCLGFESPVAKKFGITTVPRFVLTDRSHKIVASATSFDGIKQVINSKLK